MVPQTERVTSQSSHSAPWRPRSSFVRRSGYSAVPDLHHVAVALRVGPTVRRLLDNCLTRDYPGGMATSQVAFRPTEEDRRIIASAKRPDEGVTDVIRRALRLLAREDWLRQAREDAERLADEDLSAEQDAW